MDYSCVGWCVFIVMQSRWWIFTYAIVFFYLVLTFDSFAVITNEAGDGGNSGGDIVWGVVLSQVVFYVLYSQV